MPLPDLGTSSYLKDFEEDNKPNLIPVHISKDEIVYLNYLQGGQSIEPSTGLREYSKLSEALRNPEVRDLFMDLAHSVNTEGSIPPQLMEFTDEEDPVKEGLQFEPIESDNNPEVQKIATGATMEHPTDTQVVMMPQDVAQFLDELQGDDDRDPVYGLREYFNLGNAFKSIIRVGATVAGAFLGGPLGAGAGNMLGRAFTGQKPGMDMLKAGGMNALYAYGAGAGLNALGGNFGAIGANAGTGSSLIPGLSQGKAASTTLPKYIGAGEVGKTSFLAPSSSGPISSMSGLMGAGSTTSGLFGTASQSLFPLAMIAGGSMLSRKGERDEMKDYNQLRAEQRQRMEGQLSPYNESLGEKMYYQRPFVNTSGGPITMYKKGGTIKSESYEGSAKGQDDTLKKTRREGDWVWTATDVAHLGDGNTKAGLKEIRSWENKVKKTKLKPEIFKDPGLSHGGTPRAVPCLLSDGEHTTDLHLVSAVGDGSNKKGSHILREIRKELRKDKISNGLGLPPKSKGIDYYHRKVIAKK